MISSRPHSGRSRVSALRSPLVFVAALALFAAGCGPERKVTIESAPSGAAVWVGQELQGTTPLELELPREGELRLRLAYPSHLDATEVISLATAPEDRRVLIRLEPAPVFAITCTSQPTGADVFLDGEHMGQTPVELEGLQAGTSELVFRAKNRVQEKRTVTLDVETPHPTVAVRLGSLAAQYYRQQISAEPGAMGNYVDLGHHLVLEGDYEAAVGILADGIRLYMNDRSVADSGRLWSEVQRVVERQYVYGSPEDVKTAREYIRKALQTILTEFPDGEPQLYSSYVFVLDELDQRDEAARVMKEAWGKFPGDKTLARMAKRKRLWLR